MTQTMTPVQSQAITHGLLIDLDIEATTYYFTTGVNSVTYPNSGGNVYQPLGGFLAISDIQNNLQNSADELTISLSGIPQNYIGAIVGTKIKGGTIAIYRYFLNNSRQVVDNRVFARFKGIITNYSVSEDIQNTDTTVDINYTISLVCSSLFGVLENRQSGRRTNQIDYQVRYQNTVAGVKTDERFITSTVTTDPSMNRVITLFDEKFDFGMPYKAQGQSTVQNTTTVNTDLGAIDTNDIRNAG